MIGLALLRSSPAEGDMAAVGTRGSCPLIAARRRLWTDQVCERGGRRSGPDGGATPPISTI